MDDLLQFTHYPIWAAILYVAWKLANKALVVWKEIYKARMDHDQAERTGHREERRELVAGFSSLSKSIEANTGATREQTETVRALIDVGRISNGIQAHQRRNG